MNLNLTQEHRTYLDQMVDEYMEEYGEFDGKRWKYRFSDVELIDRANAKFSGLWENPVSV